MSDEKTKILGNGDDKLDRIIGMLYDQAKKIESVDSRLSSLESTVEQRLKDTRPLWEGVHTRLDQLEQNLGERLSEVERSVRGLDRRIMTLADDMIKLRADQRDLEYRVDKLEQKPS